MADGTGQPRVDSIVRKDAGGAGASVAQGRFTDIAFKTVNLLLCGLVALLLLGALVSIVTRTTPQALWDSIRSDEIQFAIRLSLLTSVSSTLLCLIVGVPAAYALTHYKFRGRGILNIIFELPLALPPVVAGMALLILFGTTGFGKALSDAGLQFVFTKQGIILAQFFVTIPFMYRIMKTTFQSINPRYEHVARTLGCSDLEVFRRVTLPMARNGLIAGSVIAWCRALGEFGAAMMVAGATRMKTETLPVALYLNMTSGDLVLAVSAATMLIVIAFVALLVFEKVAGSARIF
ncbi:MAG: molybdate ABC transporter permease subunit [Actinobacteria bacterium]|nr:molybdate ABC transporter permease subunit [Actinomycetota bacterium]